MKTQQISEGSLTSAIVHPREVFAPAIVMHAAAILVAHNHPSGDPYPSTDDRELTKVLCDTGKILGIPVLDHLVIGDARYYSFKEHGELYKIYGGDFMFEFLKNLSHDMGIDLGTANILVHCKGKGIIIREPSVVAVNRDNSEVLEIGAEAKQMIGRTPGNIIAIRPMKDGVIADFDITQSMLKYFIKKAMGKHSFVRPRIVVGVPSGVTEVEKRAVIDATIQAGAREAYLIEEPMAAAIGAGLPVQEATGSMVVDIGGGTCEVAVISLGGIVVSRSIRTGGDAIDDAIVRYIRKTFSLLIGERTAEAIKIEIGTAMFIENPPTMEIRGRDLVTGLPKNLEINANQICNAVSEPVANIVDAVRSTLEKTPPELAADIIDRGIVMTGGSSLLRNLETLLSQETGMPVYVSDEALACVVLGTGIAVENIDVYKKGFMASNGR